MRQFGLKIRSTLRAYGFESHLADTRKQTYAETKTIMMVATAYQLYTLAGVAQLVESILIEQVTFNHRVERSNRFTSTNEGQKASTFW